jgi:predicted porin
MKKSLVALAALALAGAASAQSSVTLFGVVDVGVSYYQNENTSGVKASQWALSTSGKDSSRLGFRGTEDLGGGLAAGFWLEAGLAADTGTAGGGSLAAASSQFFNRRATVSLSGGFGELRLGRDYVPTFWNDTIFDPFGTNGVGTNAIFGGSNGSSIGGLQAIAPGFAPNAEYVRKNNTVGYFLPSNLGGFYGQVMFGMSERPEYDPATTPSTNAISPFIGGRYVGGRVGYANGPIDVALAYGENTLASNFNGGGSAEINTGNIGASWDFGFMKLMGEYSQVDAKSTLPLLSIDTTYRGYLLGATFPVGPGLIRASYSFVDFDNNTAANKPQAQKFAIGYVHNLSKRTALYATAAYIKNDDATPALSVSAGGPLPAASGGGLEKSYGYDFGIRHSF